VAILALYLPWYPGAPLLYSPKCVEKLFDKSLKALRL
jgi:hypothetical protein